MTTLAPLPVSTRPWHTDPPALAERPTASPHPFCPERQGCQPVLIHGRYCVQHCPCVTCQHLRATVANHFPHLHLQCMLGPAAMREVLS